MDTEGLGALDEDSNHDVRIFSLAILLSSYFIYNSVGSIDENALQNLNLVVNLTKHI
jgi:Guanylate-binding protein, N-terminal domain